MITSLCILGIVVYVVLMVSFWRKDKKELSFIASLDKIEPCVKGGPYRTAGRTDEQKEKEPVVIYEHMGTTGNVYYKMLFRFSSDDIHAKLIESFLLDHEFQFYVNDSDPKSKLWFMFEDRKKIHTLVQEHLGPFRFLVWQEEKEAE